jgi:uncharacterized membrane protein
VENEPDPIVNRNGQEVTMNQLIVVAFDHLEDARKAMKRLREIEAEGRISFEDTAIVERMPDGNAKVRNEVSGTTETGAVVGALVGGFVLLAVPILGAALGAVAGAAVGAALDKGVDPKFIDDVKTTLTPGRSALFLVVRGADADAARAALSGLSGDIVQTTLDSETEEELRRALA